MRKLICVRLAESVGKGVFMSGSAVYFTLATGLTATQVGLGLSAAGLSGFVASMLFGMVSDRIGARRLLCLLFAVEAAGFALYPLVGGVPTFLALIVTLGFVEYGTGPAMGALVGTLAAASDRVRVRAVMRTVFNIGFSAGSGFAALAVLGRGFLDAIPLVTAVLMAIAALLVRRLPVDPPREPAPAGSRRFSAVRDTRFLGVVAISSLLATHVTIILVALPLWALNRTTVPHSAIPLLLVLNTGFVILFQVRASRGADSVAGAARTARRSGLWLAAGCGAVALTAWTSNPVAATAAVVVGVLLFSVSEITQSASAWGLAYGLAPERSQGEYLGTFDLHVIAQNVIGPAVVSGLVIAHGSWGWALIAAVAVGAALLITPATRYRPSTTGTPDPARDADPPTPTPEARIRKPVKSSEHAAHPSRK